MAAPATASKMVGWAAKREELDRDVEAFWGQSGPGIECAGVNVLSTEELTLADIEPYQRFDADWVSFADDSPPTPLATDIKTYWQRGSPSKRSANGR